ncbi:MAG: DNA polymerase I [Gammaproteobacteria bacterium]|nr:DNA polymerase I [Gammaproteobacteria bacterium]MDH5594775.1 DNA polymerase I [Gammaproteobacteria bacterium]MDH5613488.1 DNA polymerase I [Gammaproteobacteria bacterium]
MKQQQLVLVDGSSYLYRAFHAMPGLTNSRGEPTGAVYGVINMIRKLLSDETPDLIAVVFDAKGKTFRDDIYKEYKANRPPMPDDLRKQIKPLYEIIEAMGIPLISIEGVEADDVIGTLAVQAKQQGIKSLISTGDKDMAQLVDKDVTLMDTMKGSVSDPNGVKEKFGVPPERIVDYLALIGDTSDNVPGVPKCGPKTAVKWLDEYGSLDNIMENADQIKGKVGENLRATLEQLPLSRTLVTIKTDVELEQSPEQLHIKPADTEKLRTLFQNMEFKTWLSEVISDSDSTQSNKKEVKNHYTTILTQKEFNHWFKQVEKAKLFAVDLETTSLDYMQAEIVGLSFSIKEGEAVYIPVAHDYEGAPPQLPRKQVLDTLKPVLENEKQLKTGHNLKYDMSVLANYDIALRGIAYDSMLESYVIDSTATRHDMDSCAMKYLGHQTIKYEDVAGKGAKQIPFNMVPLEQAGPYAAEDADISLRLHEHLWPRVCENKKIQTLFEEMEIPLVPVLSYMERTGVLVDADMLHKQGKRLLKRMQEVEHEVHDLAGEEFNLGSPKQLQEILFEKLSLPIIQKTPKGQPSTAEPVLQELANDYPMPRLILEYRSLSKLKSTYTDKLPEQINPKTGRVHTSYHQAITATGRLSSSDPNLQNIPVRNEEGRRIRQAFIAPAGYKIVAADYSQIELRIMAHLSGDKGLLSAFSEGRDIHRATAAEVFGLEESKVSNEQRRHAKAINFGLIYGMSAFGLGKQLGIGRNEAQSYIDLYFDRYPGVKAYMDETRERAREQGYVETVSGRRLYLPDIKASNMQRRQYAERTAINAPMQGTAADIIKRAMIRIFDWLQAEQPDVKMIMQVHDELVFEVAEQQLDKSVTIIREKMVAASDLSLPMVVDTGVGENWDQAH